MKYGDDPLAVKSNLCLTDGFVSSIVNDGIGRVLYLLKKDPTSIKSIKST